MKTKTESLLELWLEARTRFSSQLAVLGSSDLTRRLGGSPNSAGFLIRHIGEVELLFAKNVFGAADVKVTAKTVIEKKDNGQWTNWDELMAFVQHSFEVLKAIIEQQSAADWEQVVTTREFGAKTKAEALGRIVSHTAYHAGQLAIICKYGTATA